MKRVLGLLIVAAMAAPASAQIVVDGTRDAGYGSALAVQTVNTEFGNSAGGLTGGGELDAGYATISGGRLYVMLTGNVENNFNKVSVFIDSQAGGENVLNGALSYDGGVSSNFGGLTFDAGFEADYHLFGRWGGFTGNTFEVDFVNRAISTPGNIRGDFGGASSGAGTAVQSGSVLGNGNGTTSILTSAIPFGFNNNNSAGVVGGTGAADVMQALAVTTGVEFSIALADLGNPAPGAQIKIHAVYGNGDNNYHSNQVLGGLPAGTGNLGGNGSGGFTGTLSGVNFNQFAGDQFFTIQVPNVPEPATGALAALAGLALTAIARRR